MIASRAPRGKIPEYPRAVPTIDVDDIPVCADTVVYNDGNTDAEREGEERAQKRRKRRREAAEIYLRGGEVRILTASLKGPFEGWKNPWARKRKGVGRKTMMEVPETTTRQTNHAQAIAPINEPKHELAEDPIEVDDNDYVLIRNLAGAIDPVNPFDIKEKSGQTAIAGQEPSSTKRVEDWLKTNNMYARRAGPHIGSSPTPTARSPNRYQTPPDPHSSPLRVSLRNPEPTSPRRLPALAASIDARTSRPGTASSAPTHESPQRAERAILEQKKQSQSVHKLPPSTNLPAFEFRRGRRGEKRGPEEGSASTHTVSNDASKEPHGDAEVVKEIPHKHTMDAPPQLKSKETSISGPALSAETSRASLANMPSAQVAPNRLGAITSNAPSTDDLLQELPSMTKSGVQNSRNASREQVSVDAAQVNPEPVADHTPIKEPETQEMIAAIKPFDFSTIKKPHTALTKMASPVTATKRQASKSNKRASFAADHPLSDDSQKCIKTSMKVRKATAPPFAAKGSVQVALFDDTPAQADSALNDELDLFRDEILPSLSSMVGQKKANAPKSILKSSNAVSSTPVASGATTSTATKQDAQIPQAGQNGINVGLMGQDDSFDLDAAMDDLGSYLGNWDAEEEATKLSAGV